MDCLFTHIPQRMIALAFVLIFASSAHADVRILTSDERGLSLAYRPHCTRIDTLDVEGKSYNLFNYDDHSFHAEQGAPLLPATSVFFAAPAGIAPAVNVSGLEVSEREGIRIAPMPVLRDDNAGFSTEIYREDSRLYAMSGYRPETFWNLYEKSTGDGFTIWELTLRPVLFDAHALTAAVADSFDVTVTFGPVSAEKQALAAVLPDFVVNRAVFSTPESFFRAKKAESQVFDPFGTGDWYRVKVTKTGIYTISGIELSQAGFPVGTIKTDDIRMYYGGGKILDRNPGNLHTDTFREIAIRIQDDGDGIFGRNDSLIFYGSSLSRFIAGDDNSTPVFQNHPYSTENVYWITVSDTGTPKRIRTTGEEPSSTIEALTVFPEMIHIEQENKPDFEETGTEWYWDDISTSSKSYAFSAPGIANGDSMHIRVGFINQAVKLGYSVNIYINDEGPFNFTFFTGDFLKADFRISSMLKSSGNLLKIIRTTGKPDEYIRLDWLEAEYPRRFEYQDTPFEFFMTGTGSPVKMTMARAEKQAIDIFDTTDPYEVVEITHKNYDSQAKTLTFQTTLPGSRRSRLMVTSASSYLKPASISKKESTRISLRNQTNGSDYIVISHKTFLSEAQRLATWRARDSRIDPLKTMTVDVQDIYDEFAWGVFDPVSIRDFLYYAWKYSSPHVRFCCLIGDTIWKYKNLTEGQTGKHFIPSVFVVDEHGCTSTDDFYTWFEPTPIPYLATGRLCVSDLESAKIVVDKIIEYERNPEMGLWHNRALFIADDELHDGGLGQEISFTYDTEAIESGSYIPVSLDRTKIYEIEYPLKNLRKPDATEVLLEAINDGYILWNYLGHGNVGLLAHEHILEGTRDIERLNNGHRQGVFFIGSCEVAHYDRIDTVSLAEMLNLRKEGGCVTVIASARKTFNPLNVSLNRAFYSNLFDNANNPDIRIGYGLKVGKTRNYNDSNANRYLLLGDPATRLMIPRLTFTLADVDSIYRLQKIDLSGNVADNTAPVTYNGTLYIKALGPKIRSTYSLPKGIKVDYTMPGNKFYNGELSISGSGFSASLVVPKDIAPTGNDSKIYFFATGGEGEATGVINNILIGDLYPSAPEDVSGPEIKLIFDGKSFEDGDYIGRQPKFAANISDQSGINIYGNRGHNITLMTDNSEIIVLTGSFLNINGYNTGKVEYALPVLTPGEHSFELSVYDTYNNISKKVVKAHVVGSETGDIVIENLLNYPNPMNSDGTTFTFNLNDDAGSAKINIYSQSGRKVDELAFSAGYGYNTLFWKPSFSLANGVYFYKLTVWSSNGRKSSKIEKLVVMR
ncbi:type IX secretion system sortase PorU [bacterium]|nr:type IX secretion system sortase PorU [bacterium]